MCAAGEGVNYMVWFEEGPLHGSAGNFPSTKDFGVESHFESGVFHQEVAAKHADLTAVPNTASLRRPTNPLRDFARRRLAQGTCSPPSIPLAPMAFDAAFRCSAALQSPALRVAKFGCKPIPGGRS